MFLEFSFEYNIPSGTVITITPPTSTPFDLTTSSNNKNQIFFSKEYTSAAISATNILITVAEDVEAGTILKLYVPSAITNP